MPVVRQLLERDQQVVALARAGAGDRTQHRQEERVDVRIVLGRVLEQQQGQRARTLRAQAGGVAVDLVVKLAHRFLDPLAGLRIHQRTATQHARDGGLRHPRAMGDVHRGGLGLLLRARGFLHRGSVHCGCPRFQCGKEKGRWFPIGLFPASGAPGRVSHRCLRSVASRGCERPPRCGGPAIRRANMKKSRPEAGFSMVARPEGFEPPTPKFVAWCSIQLSYGRRSGIMPARRIPRQSRRCNIA